MQETLETLSQKRNTCHQGPDATVEAVYFPQLFTVVSSGATTHAGLILVIHHL